MLRFRRVPAVALQLVIVCISYWVAFHLRFDSRLPDWAWASLVHTLPWLVVIRALTFLVFRLYEGLWKYTGIYDLQALIGGIAVSSLLFLLAIKSPFGPDGFPRSVIIIDALLLTMLLGGIRMIRRVLSELGGGGSVSASRVLIYGAGDAGQMIAREMRQNPGLGNRPVGFIDDDPRKENLRIHGVRVFGDRRDLARIIQRTDPTEILLALPAIEPEELRKIVRSIEMYNLPIKTLPSLREIIGGRVGVEQIRTLRVEDLLARTPVGLDSGDVRRLIRGRCVLVSGAGGSIGSELCRQIASFQPATLVMFERYENSLHTLELELQESARKHGVRLVAAVGDVTDAALVAATFAKHGPKLVFHAAAHKHVHLMEENPCEAVKNNVRGTRVLAAAAEAASVDRFILISTDKAANPSSIMGASKRLAELTVQHQAEGSGTSFAIVRFGNVLGSNGSVVPRFLEQIRKGGPVTVTHPDVRRFFMLIPEAVHLVLHAAANAKTGNTYVLDMGEQVKIVDLARNLISLSGHVPDVDIKIEFTGLRAGEKLEEELYGSGEELRPSDIPNVMMVHGRVVPTERFPEAMAALDTYAASGNSERVIEFLRDVAGLHHTLARKESAADSLDALTAKPAAADARAAGILNPCPNCGSATQRARAKRIDQLIRKRFSSLRPFKCLKCEWRGWMAPSDPAAVHGTSLEPHPTPDFSSLDQRGLRSPAASRQGFSPKDLS